MAKYFSATNIAFYDDAVVFLEHIPDDAVLISDALYREILAQQQAGFVIVAGPDGYPTVIEQTISEGTAIQHDIVVATGEVLGHVKIGRHVNVGDDGTISVDLYNAVGKEREREASKPTYGLI